MTIAKGFSLLAVVGVASALAGVVACGGSQTPAAAAPASSTEAASNKDSDDDGVFDDVDLCPNEKEDTKGAKPKDGCPDKG